MAPKLQKMGIATKMLEYICQDAKAGGFDYIEAQTQREFANDGFRGLYSMYEKCGFAVHAEKEGKIVMRKPLFDS